MTDNVLANVCPHCGASTSRGDSFCPACGTSLTLPPHPPSHVMPRPLSPAAACFDPVTGALLAGWWSRVWAYLLDFVVVMIPLSGIAIGTGFAMARTVHRPNGTQLTGDSGWGAVVIVLEVIVLSIGYFAVLNGLTGATVGMRAVGIGVRDARTNSLIGFWRGAGRFGVLYLALFIPIPGGGFIAIGLDLCSPLWDRRNQAWHDKIFRSVVIVTRGVDAAHRT